MKDELNFAVQQNFQSYCSLASLDYRFLTEDLRLFDVTIHSSSTQLPSPLTILNIYSFPGWLWLCNLWNPLALVHFDALS